MKANKIGYNSFTISILIVIVVGVLLFKNGIPNILTWDIMGYQSYLPLVFDNHSFNVELDYFRQIQETYHNTGTLYQYVDLPEGNVFIKYTIGWALLYLPFYLIAEMWASWGGYATDGFSYPYQVMAYFGSFFYFVLSVYLLRKVLLLFFNDKIAAAVLIIFGIGTNFVYMNYAAVGLTHNLVFMLVCFFILRTHRFHEDISTKNAVLLGFSVGLIAMTRTPSVVIAVFAVFYQYQQFGKTLPDKLIFFLKNKKWYIVVAGISVLVTFSPQLIYWKLTAGKFLLNSYANNPGEGMDWFSPYFTDVLFSFKGGWLIYTPIMIFSIIGFYFWIRNDRTTGIAGLITFLVFFYVVSCWTTWWYPGHFGHRGMFDIYPVLAISMGYFIAYFKHKWVYVVMGAFAFLNVFQMYQTEKGLIRGYLMTKEAYWSIFLQTSPLTEEQQNLLEIDEVSVAAAPIDISKFRLLHEDSISCNDFWLSPQNEYAPGMKFKLSDVKDKRHLLVRSQWKYEGTEKELTGKVFNTHMYHKGIPYHWRGNEYNAGNASYDSVQKIVTYDFIAPNLRSRNDSIYIGLWSQYGDSILIKSLNVKVYEWAPGQN